MKRIYTLIVLLGLVAGAVLTGCQPAGETKTGAEGTNAVPAAAPAATTNQ